MPTVLRLAVLAAVALAAASPVAQTRDAAAVLGEMRTALGGGAGLDAVRTLILEGTSTRMFNGRGGANALEILSILPTHYLEIRRADYSSGPFERRFTYYDGFAGNAPISRVDSNIQFPDPPGGNTPEAIAARARDTVRNQRRAFARLGLLLFGRGFDSYPLDFTYAGVAQDAGRAFDVVDARAADGYTMRLAVDQQTRLPAVLSWMGLGIYTVTTSSTVATRNGQVVSQQDDPMPAPPRQPPPDIMYTLVPSDFKAQDGLNWPRKLVTTNTAMTEEVKLRRVKVNPEINPRRFEIK